jgi:hypothetical protein
VIQYNDRITLRCVPEEAYRYTLGSRSAIEWIIDRYWVKTDKASGIVNHPDDWSREVGDPRYIVDLLARIVTVCLETIRLVDSLPRLMSATMGERHGNDQAPITVRRPATRRHLAVRTWRRSWVGGPCPTAGRRRGRSWPGHALSVPQAPANAGSQRSAVVTTGEAR